VHAKFVVVVVAAAVVVVVKVSQRKYP